jgi:hypothetical protein
MADAASARFPLLVSIRGGTFGGGLMIGPAWDMPSLDSPSDLRQHRWGKPEIRLG